MTTQAAAVLDAPPLGTTMRALVKDSAAPGAQVREVPVPEPGTGEILVKVLAASVCGTDVHIERWDAWAQENFGPPPMTFGHEMAGIVVARFDSMDTRFALLAWGRAYLTNEFDLDTALLFAQQWQDHPAVPEPGLC